jgi:phosphoribosyl 1,2-cyclic phosphodiesterase
VEVCVLASGSSGNCIYVAGGGTRLLVDAGVSFKTIQAGLKALDVDPATLTAALFSHDHDDHCRGVGVLWRRLALPLYANEGTAQGIERALHDASFAWRIFETGSPFTIGALTIEPFSVPHDAADTVGFVIDDGQARLGIATDFGMATALIRRKLADCDALVLESNHDVEMLRQSGRPWSLIQRISGRQGHLCNEDAAELLASVIGPRLKTVLLAHMSEKCNSPRKAERLMRETLRRAARDDVRVELTYAATLSARVVF